MSWFVAWLTLDQQRIEMRKHGLVPCITVEPAENTSWDTETPMSKRLMERYSKMLDYSVFKVVVMIITTALLAFGIYGSVNIIQR